MINGLGVGLVYGLIAIGFCVIYNASGIVNFAQGVFVMLGGMFAHTLLTRLGLPMLAAALISIVLVAMVGVLVQVLVINPMWQRKAPLFAIILATLAVQLLIEQIVILTLGDQPRTYPEFTLGGPLKLGPIAIGYQLFWILGCGALMVVALQLFFNRTRVGRALRACSAEPGGRCVARHTGCLNADAVFRAQRRARCGCRHPHHADAVHGL